MSLQLRQGARARRPVRQTGAGLRRALAGLAVAAGLAQPAGAQTAEEQTERPRVAAVSWDLAQTLAALDAPPAAVAGLAGYRKWAVTPELPAATVDIGRRMEPNLSVLRAVDPDLIVMSRFHDQLVDPLSRIAPVQSYQMFPADGDALQRVRSVAEQVARRLDLMPAYRRLDGELERALDSLSRTVAQAAPGESVYVAYFQDEQHVAVYGAGSLFQPILERAGLVNAWQGRTNGWGYAVVELSELDAGADRLVVLDPVPDKAQTLMAKSPIWRALPVVRDGRVHRIAPVWAIGGVPSAVRFARLLEDALHDGG